MSVACGNITSSVTSNEPSARGTATIRIPGFVSPGPAVAGVVRGVVVVDGRELSSPGLGATGRAALPEQAAVAPAPSASATVTSNRHPVRRSSSAPVVVCGRNPGSAAGEPRPDISHPAPQNGPDRFLWRSGRLAHTIRHEFMHFAFPFVFFGDLGGG